MIVYECVRALRVAERVTRQNRKRASERARVCSSARSAARTGSTWKYTFSFLFLFVCWVKGGKSKGASSTPTLEIPPLARRPDTSLSKLICTPFFPRLERRSIPCDTCSRPTSPRRVFLFC